MLKNNFETEPIMHNEKCDLHEYCENVRNLISKYVESNNPNIPINLLNRYIYIVCDNIFCWTLDYETNINNLNYIFKNCKINTIEIFNKLTNDEVKEIFTKYNQNITILKKLPNTDNLLLNFINQNINQLNNSENSENSKNILKEIFNIAVQKRFFKSINKLLDNKFKICDSTMFDNILFALIFSGENIENILKKCLNNGAEIKKDTLHNLINTINNSLYSMWSFPSIIPSTINDIFIFLYTNGSPVTIENILLLKKKIDIKETNKIFNILNNLNEIEITRDDFKKICEEGIQLNNFKNVEKYFNDKEIKSIIYSTKLSYPVKFDFDINILRSECKKKGQRTAQHLIDIKQILKVVKPDQECMENACLANNITLIKLLKTDYNLPITEKCIYNYSKTLSVNNRCLDLLIKNYDK
jgi:hypothetical protein